MSANPEAFEYLRQSAYRFVQKYGKDRERLYRHCSATLADWRSGVGAGSGLSDAEAERLTDAVTEWVIARYNPPAKKAERSREERAAAEVTSTVLLEFAEETFGKATVRNAARISGESKSTVARHLRQQGVSPKRSAKIRALPARVRWMVEILDETFVRDGRWVVAADLLSAAMWDRTTEIKPGTPASTRNSRRRKLDELVRTVSSAGVGYHLLIKGDHIAVGRGRRFKGMKDTATWIDDHLVRRGPVKLRLPDAPADASLFWSDPSVKTILALMQIGAQPWINVPETLYPLVQEMRLLLDPTPLHRLIGLAVSHSGSADVEVNLYGLAGRVHDPRVKAAAFQTASALEWLRAWARYDNPYDYFNDVDRKFKILERARDNDYSSYLRLVYLRDRLFREFAMDAEIDEDRVLEALEWCRQFAEDERQGTWPTPTARDLAEFDPANEPPF